MQNRLKDRKTFLVTGGLGFIGSHFVDKVLAKGHKVINIDKETYAANKDLKFDGDYVYLKHDIAKLNSLPYCDFVVNFAAESHVDNSIKKTNNFMTANVMGVHNLLELIKNNKIKNVVHSWGYKTPIFLQISTDEVFGDILDGYFKEDERHKPSNPYAASKSCAEQLVVSWGRTYDIPYLITRTTNNYGPRQHPEKLIPSVITRLLSGKKAVMHGDGRYVRNWVHVEDNVDALYKVLCKGELNSVYHIAADEEYSVKQIIEKVANLLGLKFEDVIDSSTDRSGCDERYALSCEKTKELGWKQVRKFDVELEKIVNFYRNKK